MNEERPKNAPVIMKTIAEKRGVSVTTVSRSTEDGYKTSPDVVAKVRDMANRLGYARNLDGKKLRTGKTLGVLACTRCRKLCAVEMLMAFPRSHLATG